MSHKIIDIDTLESAEYYLSLAAQETIKRMKEEGGGPFGATVVKDGEVVVTVANSIKQDMDPTAHAELIAVREACKILDTLDLSDCTIYATCEPCPMCVGAMMLAKVKTVYYVSDRYDAKDNGFSDLHLRKYLDHSDTTLFDMKQIKEHHESEEVWKEYKRKEAK